MIPWSLYFKRFPLQLLALAVFLAVTAGPAVLFIVSATVYPQAFQRGLVLGGVVGGLVALLPTIILIGTVWFDTERYMDSESYVQYIRGLSAVVFLVVILTFIIGVFSI